VTFVAVFMADRIDNKGKEKGVRNIDIEPVRGLKGP
jgi:hypothetical protein